MAILKKRKINSSGSFIAVLKRTIDKAPTKPSDNAKDDFIIQDMKDGRYVFVNEAGQEQPVIEMFFGGPRRDVATILPGDEMKVVMRFMDFEGRHVMHCHNVVHEDHAMMIRWDMLPESREEPILTSVPAAEVWQDGLFGATEPTSLDGHNYSFDHVESRPAAANAIPPSRGKGNFPPQAPKKASGDQ